jgi:hypothetical protein
VIKKKIIYGCEERGDAHSPYLIRWTLFERSWLQICLHKFLRSDHSEHHDHPWHFVSIILWRGYNEETVKGKSRKLPGMILFRKATHRHRVELVGDKQAFTLVIMGKYVREWGFFTSLGWEYWKDYFKRKKC